MKQKWAVLILLLAGIIAYANTAKNGLFWDDDEFITKNAYIRSFRYLPQWFSKPMTAGAGVNSNYYRPLLTASFSIDYHLWGLWAPGYHIENMFWHVAAAILLYLFLSELLPQIFNFQFSIFNSAKMIAFATSLLWLVHPVHVEAVAYANSRGDSMATVFILLTLILWLKKRFRASAIAFILALLSKEFAIVTPGLIILIEALRISSFRISGARREIQPSDSYISDSYIDDKRSSLIYITNLASKKLYRLSTIVVNLYNSIKPAFLHITIAIIYLTLRLTVLNFQNTLNFYGAGPQTSDFCRQQKSDVCNPFELYAASLPVRLLTFLKVLPIYGRILIWPNDLHMERTVDIPTTILDPIILLSLSFILILAGFFGRARFFSQRKIAGTPEPRTRALATRGCKPREQGSVVWGAFGWFFISILPTSGLIPISQILAEHFLYLPGIGFFLFVSWLISRLLKPKRLNDSNHLTLIHLIYWLILLGISVPLLIKTIRQNRIWRDPITFYEYTLAHAEPTVRVYNNLAMAYADRGNHQKAIENYQAAIAMGDVYPNPHYNLGNTFVELEKLDEAEREYRRALEIDPNFHYATLKLGQIYLNQGKIDEAKTLVCPVFPAQPLCRKWESRGEF